jgi:hypothetical protein
MALAIEFKLTQLSRVVMSSKVGTAGLAGFGHAVSKLDPSMLQAVDFRESHWNSAPAG